MYSFSLTELLIDLACNVAQIIAGLGAFRLSQRVWFGIIVVELLILLRVLLSLY